MSLKEQAKYVVYRAPYFKRFMAPRYRYKVNPGELFALMQLMESSREAGGAVVEIGVAQGDTSVFILEHLKTTGDARVPYFFDTFEGFTKESVDFEIEKRGKSGEKLDSFAYGDEAIFRENLRNAGYDKFKVVKGDAAKFDWSSIGPIGAVLLDIDLYQPTIAIMQAIWPYLVSGGGIVCDDCEANTAWDGSLQAYEEFIAEHNLPFERAGKKGAVVRKP